MNVYVKEKVNRLYTLSASQLLKEHERLTGESYFTRNRKSLIRKIAWLYQTQDMLPLSQLAQDRVNELIQDSRLRTRPPRDFQVEAPEKLRKKPANLPAGTTLERFYNGNNHSVIVLDRGFLYDHKVFKSISAVAKAITGTHWNGNLFFGLK